MSFYLWLARISFQNTDFFLFFAHIVAAILEMVDLRGAVWKKAD